MSLIGVRKLGDCKVVAQDGDIGSVSDLYFDDAYWVIRYLVVNTGSWLLPGREVLLSPLSVGHVIPSENAVVVNLTREQVKSSPEMESEKPLSRALEEDLSRHFGWPMYWLPGTSGSYITIPGRGESREDEDESPVPPEDLGDPDLRSANEVLGYHIHTTDGDIGHAVDFLVDDEDWNVHYMVVDTRNWLPGRHVILSLGWIDDISWSDRRVVVNVDKEKVRTSPEYDSSAPPDRSFEDKLHEHYGRPKYWERG
jgi:uncharacterized protein YrrD